MAVSDLPRTIELSDDGKVVRMVDQRALPRELVMLEVTTWQDMVSLVRDLAVRGAPALGVAGACALALFASNQSGLAGTEGEAHGVDASGSVPQASREVERLLRDLEEVAEKVANARPTAVNLSWGVGQALAGARDAASREGATPARVVEAVCDAARTIRDMDERCCRLIGSHGAELLPEHARVLTHCNAGSLACSFYGTALGVIYTAFDQGKIERVYADETRPVGQGARLTCWELARAGVPVTLQCDNMAASLMAEGLVDAVIVGADRICANGDVTNKVGTYGLAVLADRHGIPFYVAAPTSTIDPTLATGSLVTIEQRSPSEVCQDLPPGVEVRNPAFDVTPAHLVSAIITERGVVRGPYDFGHGWLGDGRAI